MEHTMEELLHSIRLALDYIERQGYDGNIWRYVLLDIDTNLWDEIHDTRGMVR